MEQIEIKNTPFVGVFDSGLGGLSVLAELATLMPHLDFEYFGDSLHAPYGTKSFEFILERAEEICSDFIYRGAVAVVIACNTATSVAAKTLREKYRIPIVGMEPAVKPAMRMNLGKNNKIAVLATPMTLKEKKYRDLVETLDARERVVEVPSPELVSLVENDLLNENKVRRILASFIRNRLDGIEHLGAIVLGCTHFVFLKKYFVEMCEGIEVTDGNLGTANRLKSLLEASSGTKQTEMNRFGRITVLNSAGAEKVELSKKLLKYEIQKNDYDYVRNLIDYAITNRLSPEEEIFAKYYYIDKMAIGAVARKMNFSSRRTAQILRKLESALFQYLKVNDAKGMKDLKDVKNLKNTVSEGGVSL